jgi:hypothetical protein
MKTLLIRIGKELSFINCRRYKIYRCSCSANQNLIQGLKNTNSLAMTNILGEVLQKEELPDIDGSSFGNMVY